MTATYTIRLVALAAAVSMTAIVHGTMLAGFDNVAQQSIAQRAASTNAVALQCANVTAQKS